MKKITMVLILIIFGALLFAQASNDNQRLEGTWQMKFNGGMVIWTFNSNGTFAFTYRFPVDDVNWFDDSGNGNYFINGSKLVIILDSNTTVYDFIISPDNKILIFSGMTLEKQ